MTTRVLHLATADLSIVYLLANQLEYLKKQGFDVITASSSGPHSSQIAALGFRHVEIDMVRDASRPWADVVALWRLFRFFRRERFDIVHTHNPKPGLLGRLAARAASVPIVIHTVHGFHFHENQPSIARRALIWLEKFASLCCHRILFQSAEDMKTALKERICTERKAAYLGNGVDLGRFKGKHGAAELRDETRQSLGIPEDAKVVGFVGRLSHPRKGVLDLIEAYRVVSRQVPESHLLIVGEGDAGTPGEVTPAQIEAANLRNVHLVGWRPNDELPGMYSAMDVLVLPSLFEGVPRSLMEGSAMGVPIVATDVQGNREAVVPGRNGVLVPFGDVRRLAEEIERLLTDVEVAAAMGREGMDIARERFEEERVFETIVREYRGLLDHRAMRGTGP